MRKISILAIIFVIVGALGYLVVLNNHHVSIYLAQNQSLQFSLWVLVIAVFGAGFLISELRQFLFHPQRLVQRTKTAYKEFQDARWDNRFKAFLQACVEYNFHDIQHLYQALHRMGHVPLYLRAQRLKLRRYQWGGHQVLQAFYELDQQFPNNLTVLLPYLDLALERQEWPLVVYLSERIHHLSHQHPQAMEGLMRYFIATEDWLQVVKYEAILLQQFGQSALAERLLPLHEKHLLLLLQEKPALWDENLLKHLPQRQSFLHYHRLPLALSEAAKLQESQQYLAAAHGLLKAYDKMGAPALLDQFYEVCLKSGQHPKIVALLVEFTRAEPYSPLVKIVLARIYADQGDLSKAEEILTLLSLENSPKPLTYYVLMYQIMESKPESLRPIEIFKKLHEPKQLLANLYQCKQCQVTGTWRPLCPTCGQLYSFESRLI